MKPKRILPLPNHPLTKFFEPAAASVTTSLGDASITGYRGTARHFLNYLGAHYPKVRSLDQLHREARNAPAPEEYGAVIGWLKLALEELRSPQSGREAEARLVPWLLDRSEDADE